MFFTHRFPRGLLLCLTLACVVFTGCEAFNDDDDDNDRDRGSERIGSDRSGSIEGVPGLPGNAEEVKEGRGELSYEAREDGTIFLYDVNTRRVVDRQRVQRGQRYTVTPDRDLATLDGRPVYEENIDRDHTHRIYFQRERDAR